MPRLYFAHPVTDYGTAFEARCLNLLSRMATVINPNAPEHATAYANQGMAHFDEVCASADLCVYARFPNFTIGAGVAREVRSFLARGRLVLEIAGRHPVDRLCLSEVSALDDLAVLSIEETRVLIRHLASAGA